MSAPEAELAARIVQHLDSGLDRIEPATRDRLQAARRAALARYREQPAPVAGLAWAGHALARFAETRHAGARHAAIVAALAAALAGVGYWQSATSPGSELVEIDAALLTGELPVSAYLDKGFDSWLKRSSR